MSRPKPAVSKRCPKCIVEKPLTKEYWTPRKDRGEGSWQGYCKACSCADVKERYRKNPSTTLIRAKLHRDKARSEVLQHYSGLRIPVCKCCGEGTYEFLVIDHINGGGNEHRRKVTKGSGTVMMSWLRKNGYPVGFQVLCHNCNMAKAAYGQCPHQEERIIMAFE